MEHAFTDQMVRADRKDLESAALTYLETYKGSWQPILDARQAVVDGYDLNVAELRMVLNAMRTDTAIRLEYTPPKGQVIQFPERRRVAELNSHEDVLNYAFGEDRKEVPKPKYREFQVNGRIKSRFVFGISMHKTALNVHYIDHSRTKFTYKQAGTRSYIRAKGWMQIWENRIEIEHFWECSSKNPKVRLLTGTEGLRLIEEGLMKLCPSCLTLRTRDC